MTSHDSKTNENPSKAAAHQPCGEHCVSLFAPNHKFIIQPKLTINQPNDIYEQEADKVADRVMRMESPFIQTKSLTVASLQRLCAECEKEEKMQRKETNGDERTADKDLENYVGNLSNSGQSLPGDVRNFYEPRFGYDFNNVKVHTDSVAAKSAQSINALAYTSGNNIVFNQGQYAPQTESGKRLLAHELTHVVQQKSSLQTKKIYRQGAPDLPATNPTDVQPGGPFDVGDNICTFQFGNGQWEACCPIPGAASGSNNACFSSDSLDTVRAWAQRRRPSLPDVNCPPGRLPNLMMGYCCPPNQIPDGVQCITPPPLPALGFCLPSQRNLLGQCCTPPQVPYGVTCINSSSPESPPVSPDNESPSEPGDWELPDSDTAVV